MISHTASTRQPPAGGPGSTAHLDGLLQELRRGERDGFLRYFQLFRSPVYDFALRLLGDETAAVAATTEAFVVGFRQVILDEADTDLRVLTWRCALEACSDAGGRGERRPSGRIRPARTDAAGAPPPRARRARSPVRGGAGDPGPSPARRAPSPRRARPERSPQTAAVFAISVEAAGTLLFRAREQFRQAFDERSTDLQRRIVPAGRAGRGRRSGAGTGRR